MQVYRGMDIGTAKPSLADRARVPHHLIDIVGLDETFDAAQFLTRARLAITQIQERGRVPVLCGGTGLYFQALWHGLGQAPPADADLRRALDQLSLTGLLSELQETDPETFSRIDRCNRRRVVRAVEVIRLSGKPFSTQRAAWRRNSPEGTVAFGLELARPELYERIDKRVDQMFEAGLIEEVRTLLGQGLG